MVWTCDTFRWSCKNSSPVDRGKKKEEGRTDEELERQHQGVDEENIRGDPGLGARPRQVEGFGPQLISLVHGLFLSRLGRSRDREWAEPSSVIGSPE
ncbi:hypothetical protein Pcinc_007305 [Petrolisthes cinctipes]|uniref:Uncharacterized protein n=1 Tax=Petrolisthes cinctipes TaxID=88211 RepID=A0AAE1KXG7_PETCI|nr:hypothetical protein Pcinc_007305 [Petrolisthes cinctipes]